MPRPVCVRSFVPKLMETPPKITALLVADAAGTLIGAVQMHDLFRARVV